MYNAVSKKGFQKVIWWQQMLTMEIRASLMIYWPGNQTGETNRKYMLIAQQFLS
jgi:hypothetical protein